MAIRNSLTEYSKDFKDKNPTPDEIRLFKQWIENIDKIYKRTLHLYPENSRKHLLAMHQFARQLSQNFVIGAPIQIGNATFLMTRVNSDGFSRQKTSGFLVIPTGNHAYANAEIPILHSRGQFHANESLRTFFGNDIQLPPYIEVYLPANFTMDELGPLSEGWVHDYFGLTYTFPIGMDGLPGRVDGHFAHEAFHKMVQLYYPELYLRLLGLNPHLDEALAKISEMFLHPLEDNPFSRVVSFTNPHLRQLKRGMMQSEFGGLTVETLEHPLGFRALDGAGRFNHDLYAHRLCFSMFITVLIAGINFKNEQGLNGYKQIISSRMREGFNNLRGKENAKRIMQTTVNILAKLASEQNFTEERFWQLVMPNIDLRGSAGNYTNFAEYLYQSYAAFIWTNFTINIIGLSDEERTKAFNRFQPEIRTLANSQLAELMDWQK